VHKPLPHILISPCPRGADEEGTLARLKTHRRELIDPKTSEHSGRIVKTTGDGMLVESGSVVDALRCTVEVQQPMAERNIGVAPGSPIELRIGINLGGVIVVDQETADPPVEGLRTGPSPNVGMH
jgi:adenylate cyclase